MAYRIGPVGLKRLDLAARAESAMIFHKRGSVIAVLCSTLFAGCGVFVERAKYDALQQQMAETAKKLKESQEQLAQYQAHRYQTFRVGLRTWRLDTVTGDSCLLLTTDTDWKTPGTKGQGCSCEDLRKANSSFEVVKAMGCL